MCVNWEVNNHVNPFHDDYYKKAIYHQNSEQSSKPVQKQIAEGPSKERKQALFTIDDDEGFNWSKYLKEVKRALVAEVKTKEEILQEKTSRERHFVDYRIKEIQKEYDEAWRMGRWDKKRECYINHKGDPVVDLRKMVYNDVVVVIPLSEEYYSKKEADKNYLKKQDKIIGA
ncbi:hypothetical protein Hanom_Chr15g01368421 [Helianthus anomalus]